jgi:hypothetical protein
MRTSSAQEARMNAVDLRRREADLLLARLSSDGSAARRVQDETAVRKEVITSMIFGLTMLLAPIVVLLLNALLLNMHSSGLSR